MNRGHRVWTAALSLLALLFFAAGMAWAETQQRTATVTATAPVFGSPNANQSPLRVAREGSALLPIDTSPEWTQVEFQDPDLGRRVGYVQTKYVRISGTPARATEPVHPQLPRPSPVAPRPPAERSQARVDQQRGDVT